MNCANCGATLSCGCQKRVATNGKQCCSNCITKCNQEAGVPAAPVKPASPGQGASFPPGPIRTAWRK